MRQLAESAALLEMVMAWAVVSLRYHQLPAMIPSIFNGGGDAHGLGDKNQLWLMVVLGTFLYLLMTGISRIPDLPVNVPAGTPPATVVLVRQGALDLLLAVKTMVIGLFLLQVFYGTQLLGRQTWHIALMLVSLLLVGTVAGCLTYLWRTLRTVR